MNPKFIDHKYIELYMNNNWLYFIHDDQRIITKLKYIGSTFELSMDNYLQSYSIYRNSKQPHHITLK